MPSTPRYQEMFRTLNHDSSARELKAGVRVAGFERHRHPDHKAELDDSGADGDRLGSVVRSGPWQQGHCQGGTQGQEDDHLEEGEASWSAPDPEGQIGQDDDHADTNAKE